MIHRGDLQAALLDAVRAHPDITLALGAPVDGFATHPQRRHRAGAGRIPREEPAGALVGADGLWSHVRALVGETDAGRRFARRTAWRALVPADAVAPEFRAPAIHLWLGRGSHLVHYPVKGGAMINIVAIAADAQPSARAGAPPRRPTTCWRASPCRPGHAPARDLLALPAQWLKWPLYDRRAAAAAGPRPGDAARRRRPSDAAVSGAGRRDGDRGRGRAGRERSPRRRTMRRPRMRRYEQARRPRTARVRRAARRNDTVYHLAGRRRRCAIFAMGRMGNERLLAQLSIGFMVGVPD